MKNSITETRTIRRIFRQTLRPLYKTGLLLMKDLLKPLAKSVLIPLELNTAALATNAAIENNFFIEYNNMIIFK